MQAAEKGFKRLWEAYDNLRKIPGGGDQPGDADLDAKVRRQLSEMDDFMNDDFHTAKVLANMFDIVPVINSIKDKHMPVTAISKDTLKMLQTYFKSYLEDILGFRDESFSDDDKLGGALELLIQIRKEAKSRKDYATSDKIRNQLSDLGILLKDEKDGNMSYTFA